MTGRVHRATYHSGGGSRSTGGMLVPWPRDPEKSRGERLPLVARNGDLLEDPNDDYEPHNYRRAFLCRIPQDSRRKYRIPTTSVVHRIADFSLVRRFPSVSCCIWLLNLLAFVCFLLAAILLYHFHYNTSRGEVDLRLPIYRLTNANWTNATEPHSLIDNAWPLDTGRFMELLMVLEAALAAIALIAGPAERFWFVFWRQLDDAFCWWRWTSYAFTDSMLILFLAALTGIQEENSLACFFVLTFCWSFWSFCNELWSRPRFYVDETDYKWELGPPLLIEGNKYVPNIGKPNYEWDPRALKRISESSWEGDRPLWDENGKYYRNRDELVEAQRFENWQRRVLPWAIGIVPGVANWVLIIKFYMVRNQELRQQTNNDWASQEDWFVIMLFGSAIIAFIKNLILPIWEFLPPGLFYGSEILLIVINVLQKCWVSLLFLIFCVIGEDNLREVLARQN